MGNLSHFGINCAPDEYDEIIAWYLATLKPLGYKVMMTPADKVAGLGNGYAPEFWIVGKKSCEDLDLETRKKMGTHYAFWGKGW